MTLSTRQQQIVLLVSRGLTRWKIAEELGVSETTVRDEIRSMCDRFSCTMRDLPRAVAEDWERY
jgi:DNA-binding NarL/FixJ family response regulator